MIPKNIFEKVHNNIGKYMVDNFDSVGINQNCGKPDLMNCHRGVNLPNRDSFFDISCPTLGSSCEGCIFMRSPNTRITFIVLNDGSLIKP